MPPKTFSLIFQEGTFPAQKKKTKKAFLIFCKMEISSQKFKKNSYFSRGKVKASTFKKLLIFFHFFLENKFNIFFTMFLKINLYIFSS